MQENTFAGKTNIPEIFTSTNCGLIITDSSRIITLLNNRASEILNVNAGDMVGKSIETFLSQCQSVESKMFYTGLIAQKEVIFYHTPIVNEGQREGEAFLFDSAHGLIPKVAQPQQIDCDHTLGSLVESFYDGIIIISDNRIVRINSSFGRITGLKSDFFLNMDVGSIDGEKHVCLHTIQEVVRLVQQFKKSITSMGKLSKGHEIYVTGTPIMLKGSIKDIIINIRDITELQTLKKEVSRLMALYLSTPEDSRIALLTGNEIIAENHKMKGILDLIARVAQVDSTVLLEGESGTGKEVLARLLHRYSARCDGPFIPVNCGAIPDNLFESEFFGYSKGAFTGALKDGKPGLFELADKGIIFLDEVAELPLSCQVKLLKILEDMEFIPVGGTEIVKLDVRVIGATNKDLNEMVKKGEFREDLFYRLYVVPIEIPPLRDRREDIFPVAWHYLCKYNEKFNQSKTFTPEIIQVMESYPWPGNVRELQNVVERMVVTSLEEVLQPHHLPSNIYDHSPSDNSMIQVKGIMSLNEAKETVERKLLTHAMSIKKTTREIAGLLGVDHSTVVRKMKKYDIKLKDDDILM